MTESVPCRAMSTSSEPLSAAEDRYLGGLAGMYGNMVHGWAIDLDWPDARVVIEILLDGQLCGICIANQVHASGLDIDDNLHGFSFPIPENLLRTARQVNARIANHAALLGSPIQLATNEPVFSAIVASQLWYGGGLVLSGWLWDPQAPGKQLDLIASEGTRVVARARANRPHPAMAQQASAEHGFLLELPWHLADGIPHDIHVTDTMGRALAGSPVTICAQVDGVSGLLTRMWPTGKDGVPLAPDVRDSLVQLARVQERFSPPSIGFTQYPAWFALHERSLAAAPVTSRHTQVCLLVSEGDEESVARSVASANTQRHQATIAHAVTGDLRVGIIAALDAGAELVVPLSAGDWLAPQYVDHVLNSLDMESAVWAFTDCDQDDKAGKRSNPWLKPSWDPDLFFGMDIVTAGSCWTAALLRSALAYSPHVALPDWQCVSVLLAHYLFRTASTTSRVARCIGVLYHRSSSRPAHPAETPRSAACMDLLQSLACAIHNGATVGPVPTHPMLTQVRWPLPELTPRVTLIVPTRDQHALLRACVEGLLNDTDYAGLEIMVVDNQSTDPVTLAYLDELVNRGVRVLRYPHPFNYAAMNNFAVENAHTDVIGFINNDIEVMHRDWLQEMVAQVIRPNVGAVGAKLLWKNGMVQHGGVVVGIEGLAMHTGNTSAAGDLGLFGENQVVRRQTAVTAACMLIKRELFLELGGFDANKFPVSFNDVDLCMKAVKAGKHNIWTPAAVLYHLESASRGKDDRQDKVARAQREQKNFRTTWRMTSGADAAYHPYLTGSPAIGPYGALALPVHDEYAVAGRHALLTSA